MPPEAKVFIAEDNLVWRSFFADALSDGGHQVVATASSMDEVNKIIPQLGELGVQVALVDGNLTPEAFNGSEGRKIVSTLRQIYPDISVVGVSMNPNGVDGANLNLTKRSIKENPENLNKVITNF